MNTYKKLFTYEEALTLLTEVQEITQSTVSQVSVLAAQVYAVKADDKIKKRYEKEQADAVNAWVEMIEGLGCEVKGLWLVDFDNGEGYYCWQYPEKTLEYFHGYSEGFAGRTRLF